MDRHLRPQRLSVDGFVMWPQCNIVQTAHLFFIFIKMAALISRILLATLVACFHTSLFQLYKWRYLTNMNTYWVTSNQRGGRTITYKRIQRHLSLKTILKATKESGHRQQNTVLNSSQYEDVLKPVWWLVRSEGRGRYNEFRGRSIT